MSALQDPGALPALLLEPLVRAALAEDLGRAGDITTDAIVPADARSAASFVARQPGVVAGLDLAALAFRLLDPGLKMSFTIPDGARVAPGDLVARVEGPARAMLTGERLALNFLGHLSGIASVTRRIVDSMGDAPARVTCTRKTTPGLRAIEKYAVRCGGGANHRFGLDDAVLIKDNHIAIAGSIAAALERVRGRIGHLVKVEIEVDTLDQLEQVLAAGADAVLLDNMDPATLRRAVGMVGRRMVTEASGRVTPETAPAIAASGVDLISVGWLTHSAPVLDIGLDMAMAV